MCSRSTHISLIHSHSHSHSHFHSVFFCCNECYFLLDQKVAKKSSGAEQTTPFSSQLSRDDSEASLTPPFSRLARVGGEVLQHRNRIHSHSPSHSPSHSCFRSFVECYCYFLLDKKVAKKSSRTEAVREKFLLDSIAKRPRFARKCKHFSHAVNQSKFF
jgi:hypothetical protein